MLRRSIGARLAAAYLIPSLVGLAALGFYVDRLARQTLDDELGRKLVAIASAAAAVVPAERIGYLTPGEEGSRTYRNIHERLEELRAATGVRRIALFDRAERTIIDVGGSAAIGEALPELARDRLELSEVFGGTPQASQVLFESGDRLYKTGYAPVRLDGAIVAAVLTEGSAGWFASLREFRASLLALGILSTLGVVLISFLFARQLVKPIRTLVAAAIRMGGGDLATPLAAPKGRDRDELGILARTLEETRGKLLARDRQLQAMLAGIAHEVRNPLGGMELYAGLLLEELSDDDAKAQHVRKIKREIGHLETIVSDFLDYARERPLMREPLEARALLEEVAQLVAQEARARDVSLHITAEPAELVADPQLVRRALLNLVHNALQASPAGGSIELGATARGEALVLTIEDRGPGVASGSAEEIFEPFFTTKEKGTGLGLAFARKIAQVHGGTLVVEPREGGGASFRLTIPLRGTARPRAHEGREGSRWRAS